MKVIVADKISERGVELLRSAGWNIVLTTKTISMPRSRCGCPGCAQRHESDSGAAGESSAPSRGGPRRRCVDKHRLEEATRRGVLVMSTPGGNAGQRRGAYLSRSCLRSPGKSRGTNKAIHEGRWEKIQRGGHRGPRRRWV